jgi:hypothetical protein
MSIEIRTIDDGEMIEVKVTEHGIEKRGLVSSMHLVPTKTNQLRQAIAKECTAAYLDRHGISQLEAAAMDVPMPYDDPLA